MASESNTPPSLQATSSNISDQSLPDFRRKSLHESSIKNTVEIRRASFSSDRNIFESKTQWSVPETGSSTEFCWKQQTMEYAFKAWIDGEPHRSLQWHKENVLNQLAAFFGVPVIEKHCNYKEELVQLLLSKGKRKKNRNMPVDLSEWNKLLYEWLRQNIVGQQDVKQRDIYRILAVDGFGGFENQHLKSYIPNLIEPVRKCYRRHYEAVRCMYRSFDSDEYLASLTGIDSACVVFLALLQLYTRKLNPFDDLIATHLEEVKQWVESFLHRNSNYYKDVRGIDERVLERLGRIYAEAVEGSEWTQIGEELIEQFIRKKLMTKKRVFSC